jgi:endoglucanase
MAVGMLWDRGVGGRFWPLVLAIALASLAGCGGDGNGGMGTTPTIPSSMSSPPPTTTTPPPTTSTNTPGAGSWHTSGNEIRDVNNLTVRMTGVNWYGFETTDHLAHG